MMSIPLKCCRDRVRTSLQTPRRQPRNSLSTFFNPVIGILPPFRLSTAPPRIDLFLVNLTYRANLVDGGGMVHHEMQSIGAVQGTPARPVEWFGSIARVFRETAADERTQPFQSVGPARSHRRSEWIPCPWP